MTPSTQSFFRDDLNIWSTFVSISNFVSRALKLANKLVKSKRREKEERRGNKTMVLDKKSLLKIDYRLIDYQLKSID